MPRVAYLAAAVLALAVAGCATTAPVTDRQGAAASPDSAPAARDASGEQSETDPPDSAADTTADAPPGPPLDDSSAAQDLRARLVARARSLLGRRGPFQVAGERFNGDCSGFAQAVYAAEGIDLRGRMQRAAPRERRGVKAAWRAARDGGRVFGEEASPEPGDLVFWHDTYDRNRNGKADDPLTHLGIVEHVEDGTVSFLHRGGKGVARGVMTLGRRREGSAPDGRRLNSVLRARSHPVKSGGLAAELFAGYGRVEEARVAVATEEQERPPSAKPPQRRKATTRARAAATP